MIILMRDARLRRHAGSQSRHHGHWHCTFGFAAAKVFVTIPAQYLSFDMAAASLALKYEREARRRLAFRHELRALFTQRR